MNKKKVVIYTRVSTDEQRDNGFSLRDQESRLRKECQKKNYEIIEHYQDDHCAKDFNRPEFQKFLVDIEDKRKTKPDIFLCVRYDRFSRDLYNSIDMLKRFKKKNIIFETLEGDVDLSVPENYLIHVINLALPQIDNERRALNTKRGMRQARKEGRWVGSPPLGYSYSRTAGKSILVPNEYAPLILKAFNEFAKGLYPADTIRKKLNKEGVKCSKNQFPNILRNVVYIGKIRIEEYNDESEIIVPGLHESIIDDELFDNVQDILEGRRKHTSKPSKANERLPLRGHLICDKCGKPLTGSGSKGRSGEVHFYYHCQKGCKERYRADNANDEFICYLNSLKVPKEITKLYYEAICDLLKTDDSDRIKKIKELEKLIEDVDDRINLLVDKYVDNAIDQKTFDQAKKRYESEKNELVYKHAEMNITNTGMKKYFDFGFSLISNLPEYYKRASVEIKQKITGSIFPEKLIYSDKEYRTTKTNALFELFVLNNNQLRSSKNEKAAINSGLHNNALPLGLEPRTP